jgi:hypothetical protein
MHYASLILALAAVIPAAHGHCMLNPYFLLDALLRLDPVTFVRVAVNGEWQAPFQFIR